MRADRQRTRCPFVCMFASSHFRTQIAPTYNAVDWGVSLKEVFALTAFSAVFIDTSIFDSHNYEFTSPTLTAFVTACNDANVPLVLPDPNRREIERHIKNRTNESLDLLRKVRKICLLYTSDAADE